MSLIAAGLAGAKAVGGRRKKKKAGDAAADAAAAQQASAYEGANVIDDFLASGEYDPGGSQSTGSSNQNSSSGGSSSSSSSSHSGYNLENAQRLLDEWETTYGGLEDNLSDYYNNLDPDKYATQYKSNLNENIDKQVGQMNDEMASSGLMSAGMKAQGAKEAAFAKATGGAQADLMAEDKVMGMKTDFLNRGENRKAMYDNALTGVSTDSSSSSSSSNFSSSVGSSNNQSSSRNSNYAPVSDKANIIAGGQQADKNQSAQDTAGWVSGGLNLAGNIGGKVVDNLMW